jgi:hypothetical protein
MKLMPLLGQAGRPQKKQFSTRILRLGPTGVVVGCRGVCRVCTTATGVDAGLDVPEKKLTAFAGGKEVGEGPYRVTQQNQSRPGLGLKTPEWMHLVWLDCALLFMQPNHQQQQHEAVKSPRLFLSILGHV